MICCSIGQIDLHDWMVIDERRLKQHVVRYVCIANGKNKKRYNKHPILIKIGIHLD
jgi:hypothetical protein